MLVPQRLAVTSQKLNQTISEQFQEQSIQKDIVVRIAVWALTVPYDYSSGSWVNELRVVSLTVDNICLRH